MNIPTRPLASDETIGETVKRKNIGDETVRESQIEMNDEKNERLSETIFMLMLELRLAKKEIKRLRTRVAEPGGLNDLSLIGGDVREKLDFYREKNEKLERENSNLRFQNDKFKNLEIEYNYFKESFTKIEELYMLEQQKRKFLENKLGELNAHEISIIEETFEEKFKYTHHVEEQYTQEVFGQRGKLMTSEGSTPLNSNLENSGNISLLSKNIQKKVKQRPDEYNLRAKDLEREIYILSKEVDRLNIENQRFIEENIILAEKLRSAGVDAPDFLSDKFVSGGPGLNPYGSELVEPSEIEIPDGKENFPQLLSNDNTFFMKERIEKLENQTEIYVETIKELEDKIDELKKKNIKLDNTLRLNMKDNARESTQLERENRDLKDKLENIKMKTQNNFSPKSSSQGAMPNETYLEKFENEKNKFKMILTQKQREIIYYKQILKDNNLDFGGQSHDQGLNNFGDTIVEEEEFGESNDFERKENEVNAQLPGFKFSKKRTNTNNENPKHSAGPESDMDIMVTPSFKELSRNKDVHPNEMMKRIEQLENQIKKQKSNYDVEKKDLQNELLKNEEDLKLLLRRNGDLEESLERMREKQKKLKEKLRNQVNVKVKESEAEEELKKNLKNSLLQQNLEKIKNISASLLNQREEEYQREMRKLKLTMQNLDNANLSEKNNELLNSLRKKKRSKEFVKEGAPNDDDDVDDLRKTIKEQKSENELLKENLNVYKDEVENMMDLLGKIEGQVEALEKENDELSEELEGQNKQLDTERENYKDLKEQYLDQIEINNKRNKEIMMLKNQLSRQNDLNQLNSNEGMQTDDPNKVRVLEAEVINKNEVITMLKNDIRDKENQKSHLSQKIRDLEVLFRDMERENQKLRKLKEVDGKNEDDPQAQLYVQIIKQQQGELKKWRASQLTPEEIPKLQIIIQDQHKEILQLKSMLKAEGKSVPDVNQSQLMEVIRKQQAEINRLKSKEMPSTDDLEDPNEKMKQLMMIVRQQQQELIKLREQKEQNPIKADMTNEKIQQLMKVIKKLQDENDQLKTNEDPTEDTNAKLNQYVQIIKQQRDEIGRLQQGGGNTEELQRIIESKSDEIFFLKKRLNEQSSNNVQSSNPDKTEEFMKIISGQNQELENLKRDLSRLQAENDHLKFNSQGSNPNTKNLMEIIQKQQNELNDIRMNGGGGGNSKELMEIIKRQQEELNNLRLMSARNDKIEDMAQRLKEKQDEINRLRMATAGMQTNEELIRLVKEKQDEINRIKKSQGNKESVERLMQLVKEKQDEINELRVNRRGQQNNKKMMELLKQKQEEINQLRMEKAKSQNSEELKKIIQEKQNEINRLKSDRSRSSENMRKEIELQNEISRLKPFEIRSQQLDNIVNDLEKKVFELQTANPEMANTQRLGDIIKKQQEDINRYKAQLGGRDWAGENEQLRAQLNKFQEDNNRLKLNLREVQQVNKSNKEIYLHEKETLIREVNTLKREVEVREERIVETRQVNDLKTEELEAEVRELSMMVNQVMQNPGNKSNYEAKYREQKAINTNWRQKAEDYDNLKQLYEQKLLENEAKIIRLNNLELKMFILLTQLRTLDPNFKASSNKEQPVIYQGVNRFQKKTASPNVQSTYRKSSPAQSGYRGSNPLQNRVNSNNYRNYSPSPSGSSGNRNYMVVTNNDGTYTKRQVSPHSVSHNTKIHKASYTSTNVNEYRTREVSNSPINRPSKGTGVNRIMSKREKLTKKADIFSSTTTQKKKLYVAKQSSPYVGNNRSPSPYSGHRTNQY